MKNIPMFTTDHGVASLILKEIPYRKIAYIRILDVQPGELEDCLRECISFCRMAGAEYFYAAGHEGLEQYPLYTAVIQMSGQAQCDEEKCANLFPVTQETVGVWREIYNRRMENVDNAGTLTYWEEGRILDSGGAYFVHDYGKLLGIGWLEEDKLLAVAAQHPGAGERVMHTLMSLREGEQLQLEVASTNMRAIRLYEKLGFLQTGEIARWYRVG